eukprot:TRINITY_DN3556_c0_g1_i4.p1 TRINITY_DN3556_c0_g1~~TRINITY_DN3556_c0_g1_i4.p1  ORF type:complete len:269 (+),score=34.53 TRINITY_DN3556_c0_g1_i4:76-882(+)
MVFIYIMTYPRLFENTHKSFVPWSMITVRTLSTPCLAMEFPFSSDSSTGYLQDAISELSNESKRRRVIISSHDQTTIEPENLIQNYLNCTFSEDPFANDRCWSENTTIVSGDPLSSPINSITNGTALSMETKTQEESTSENERLASSPSNSYKDSLTNDPDGKDSPVSKDPLSSESHCSKRKNTTGKRVAYPFAVVKPGGLEGDVTLDDINERILMRPTRPVRHPVGQFACHPFVSADGPGLSGKAVVALTRIQTQGRGTVTIIRTKG